MSDYSTREIRALIRFLEACQSGSIETAFYQCGRLDEMGVIHPYLSVMNVRSNMYECSWVILEEEIQRLKSLLPGGNSHEV